MHGVHAHASFDDVELDLKFKNLCKDCPLVTYSDEMGRSFNFAKAAGETSPILLQIPTA